MSAFMIMALYLQRIQPVVKMKKTITLGIIFLLVISSAIALYSSKEEARTAILNYISTRDTTVNQTVTTITYTKEPECKLIESKEKIYDVCIISFEFNYNKETIESQISVLGDSTDEEIDNKVNKYVKEHIKQNYPKEEFKYERTGFSGRKIKAMEMDLSPSNLYYCSTNPSRTETCVCLSSTKRTCYYQTCGKSPYGVCTLGEWIEIRQT